MNIVTAFISDRGQRYLPACIGSYTQNLGVKHPTRIIDDSDHRLGMAGAVRAAWEWAIEEDGDFLFHVEEDFTFNEPLDLGDMADILILNDQLAQVVLKRQPWSPVEIAAGGIIEMAPDQYTDGDGFIEHGKVGDCGFSLNPCLIPRRILELGWPDGNEAEFTQVCLDAGYRFAFYGNRSDPPRVQHIGAVRGVGWRL